MNILYTAEATATGGRGGRVESSDGNLVANLTVPPELGGTGGSGTNPEQLFAAGFAACFENALIVAARRLKKDVGQSSVRARVGIGRAQGGGYNLQAELMIQLPGLSRAEGEALIEAADRVCPYSNATRGNIEVKLTLDDATAEAGLATQ